MGRYGQVLEIVTSAITGWSCLWKVCPYGKDGGELQKCCD